MHQSCAAVFALFVLASAATAGQTGYRWFDATTCLHYGVSSDDYVEGGGPRCFDFYRPSYQNGELTRFSFAKNSVCGPLAGATYKLISPKDRYTSAFRCVAGCKKATPVILEDEPEEASGDELSRPEIQKARKMFSRKCSGLRGK
jgi:hypothetical protein